MVDAGLQGEIQSQLYLGLKALSIYVEMASSSWSFGGPGAAGKPAFCDRSAACGVESDLGAAEPGSGA